MPGYFQVSLQCSQNELVPYCRRLEETIDSVKLGSIDEARFEEAKSLVLREFKESFREPYSQLYELLETDLFELGLNYIPTFSLRVKRVSPTILQNVVKTHFDSRSPTIVVAGSAERLEPAFREIGSVEVLK
jgi:predicted Zn-dependent peptidase